MKKTSTRKQPFREEKTGKMPADFAVLFDWDGVVVDSSRHHLMSWRELSREIGKPVTEEQFRESFGQVNRVIIPGIFGWSDDPDEIRELGLRKEALYRVIVAREGLTPLPGVLSLIEELKAARVPRVIGTSTDRENITTALAVMDLQGAFDGIVASEDVARGKPHPEVFLKAAAVSGIDPGKCIVLEDSHHGLEAAAAGGMKSVGVLTTHPREKLGEPDLFVESLEELSVDRLRALVSQADRP